MKPTIDPRDGDIEDDASSTKRRSMLSLAGSLFAEISPAKLVVSWTMLFVLPGLLLGLTPLIASAWIILIKDKIASPLIGIWPILLLALCCMRRVAGSEIDSPDGGKQLLVAELAGHRTGLRHVP